MVSFQKKSIFTICRSFSLGNHGIFRRVFADPTVGSAGLLAKAKGEQEKLHLAQRLEVPHNKQQFGWEFHQEKWGCTNGGLMVV